MAADALILGSPIYVGDITGMIRSFIERLALIKISYSNKKSWHETAPKNGALIYTMNGNKAQSKLFSYIYMMNTGIPKKFGGHTYQLLSIDTYLFDDYSKFDATKFDEKKKEKIKETIFPKDCAKAYRIGKKLVVK